MRFIQSLLAALIGPRSKAAKMAEICDTIAGSDALVRNIVCRETLSRHAKLAEQSGMGWIWKFEDGSQLTANDFGVWVR
jgi:hypothetical protein